MKYELYILLRKIHMRVFQKNCSTCIHYDGRFGEDCCFECERSIRAVNYERSRT